MTTLLVHLHHRRRCRHAKAAEADFAVRKDLGPVVGKVNNAIHLVNAMGNAMVSPVLIRRKGIYPVDSAIQRLNNRGFGVFTIICIRLL